MEEEGRGDTGHLRLRGGSAARAALGAGVLLANPTPSFFFIVGLLKPGGGQ